MNRFYPAARHPLASLAACQDTQRLDQCGSQPKQKTPESNAFADLLLLQDIVIDLDVSNKAELLDAIGQHMAQVHACNPDWVTKSLARREMVGSTAVGQGVAIPHARVLDIDQIKVAYFRLKMPIDFEAPDGQPVSDIVVLLVPKKAAQEHLSILADTSRMFADSKFREHLRQCSTERDVLQLVKAFKS